MKKFVKSLVAILCIFAMCVGFTACKDSSNTLKVGITYYEPMNYKNENGELVGFETEFANKFAEKYGYKVKFVEIDWDKKVISLNAKEIDLIWNGMTITDELKEAISISKAYLTNKQVAVMKKSNESLYIDKASLANANVIVEGGSAGENAVSGLTVKSLIKAKAQANTVAEIKSGASDVAIIDYTMAKQVAGENSDNPDLIYVEMGFAGEEYGIGARKNDSDLLNKINECIDAFKLDNTLDNLASKYDLTDLLVK